MDETWVHQHMPKSNLQSVEWTASGESIVPKTSVTCELEILALIVCTIKKSYGAVNSVVIYVSHRRLIE